MIRLANLEDLNKIELIEQQFGAEAFTKRSLRHLISGDNIALVIDIGGEIVGYCVGLIRSNSSSVRLYSLMIGLEHRNKGYGTELLHFFERMCKARGASRIGLEVSSGNDAAIALYRLHGFQNSKIIEDYYTDGTSAIKMIKVIIPTN